MRLGMCVGVLALVGACATRSQPYRFASPMLGRAAVPDEPLDPRMPAPATRPPTARVASRRAGGRGWQADAQSTVRSVSVNGIAMTTQVASGEAADAVPRDLRTQGVVWSRLPAPHRTVMDGMEARAIREPAELRARVGHRDRREPFAVLVGWLDELGVAIGVSDGAALVAWASAHDRLRDPTASPAPGDLLVFDHVASDARSDLVAIVIGRDARGVTEFVYPGGGVIRRGFVDPTRARTRRDLDGAIVNTFMRSSRRWPPRGTRYLAGELLAHVVDVR